uniref:Uncharacterized protein n=1 Tax=Bionectria ochroleuca TaxID=29856 RepID=A0A8H7TMY3_BIOOC
MLPSSVRRVVTAAPQASGLAATLVSSAPKAAASAPFISHNHQRRFSSSKPSRSDNGASDLPAGQSVPASSGSSRGQGKAGAEKRKRKAAERDPALKNLPSVPNTHHMSGEALGLSSFFSLHRPISITQTMPRAVTDEQFASIFASRSKSNTVSETMSTLSNTIDQLEGPMAQMTINTQQEGHGDGVHRMDFKNPDGSEASIYLEVDAMSGDFLPFRPLLCLNHSPPPNPHPSWRPSLLRMLSITAYTRPCSRSRRPPSLTARLGLLPTAPNHPGCAAQKFPRATCSTSAQVRRGSGPTGHARHQCQETAKAEDEEEEVQEAHEADEKSSPQA